MQDDREEGGVAPLLAASIGILFFGCAFIYFIIVFISRALSADVVCPSFEEARRLYPGRHLWWYSNGQQRCWTDQRKKVRDPSVKRHYSVNRNPLRLGKPPIDGNGMIGRHSGRPLVGYFRDDEFNEIDANAGSGLHIELPILPGTDDIVDVYHLDPMTLYPMRLDIDYQLFVPWQQRVEGWF